MNAKGLREPLAPSFPAKLKHEALGRPVARAPRAYQIGSTPLALSVVAAAGAVRKRISALAASAGKADFRLQFIRDRTDNVDAGNIGNAGRDDHDHVRFAASDHLDSIFCFHRLELVLHRCLDAHPVEQTDEINAAGAFAGRQLSSHQAAIA